MRLTIDGNPVADSVESVDRALELARDKAAEAGRLVIEVIADGEPATALLDSPQPTTAGVNELGVVTVDRHAFLRESLLEARDAMTSIRADQEQAATMIDEGKLTDAVGSIQGIMVGWESVNAVIVQASALTGVELGAFPVKGEPAIGLLDGLAGDLRTVREAVTGQDWSALGDALRYDLNDRGESWTELIDALVIESGKGANG